MEASIGMIARGLNNGQNSRSIDGVHPKNLLMSILMTVLYDAETIDPQESLIQSFHHADGIGNSLREIVR
jgi:hypothetical protein